jgi:hypothetical protein
MKSFGPLLPALALLMSSCERHELLEREIATLELSVKENESAIRKHEADVAALGGSGVLDKLNEQTAAAQQRVTALEFENNSRDRKWSAIEAEFSQLKPAAEAFKASQPK